MTREALASKCGRFVRESNRIEGIERDPFSDEIVAHEEFLALSRVGIPDLEKLVGVLEPGARLRERLGLDVYVGSYRPPPGGPAIRFSLAALLMMIQEKAIKPWQAHARYEKIHPFTDGNGRTGRALWAWHMKQIGLDPYALPFLHLAYYQALDAS